MTCSMRLIAACEKAAEDAGCRGRVIDSLE